MRKARLLLLAIFVVLLGTVVWYANALRPVDAGDDVRRIIDVPSGATLAQIASLLAEKDVIRSPLAFRAYARLHGLQGGVKAGSFVLRRSMDAAEVARILTQGHGEEASLTIPEGFTVREIDALLAEKGISAKGEVLDCAQHCDFSSFAFLPGGVKNLAPRGGKVEGYLFPDTYFIVKEEFVPKFFLERLLTTFRKRVADGLSKDVASSGHSLHEILTMASLVEEESRNADERPVVAGILWKRLRSGMSLGVDAAVRYAAEKPTGALTKEDLDSDSPYNLRRVRGLPPGPIANPSLSSIQAALHPQETPYLYYLHDRNGQIHYAVTNDEHNANRARYLP